MKAPAGLARAKRYLLQYETAGRLSSIGYAQNLPDILQLAVAGKDLLAQAEVLFQMGSLRPYPLELKDALGMLQRARSIFAAHGVREGTGKVDVAIAQIQLDLGEVSRALQSAQAALADAGLQVRARVEACLVLAQGSAFMGDFQQAWLWAAERAQALSNASRSAHDQILVDWVQAQVLLHEWLALQAPGLWHGLSLVRGSGMNVAQPEAVAERLQRTLGTMPEQAECARLTLDLHFARALCDTPEPDGNRASELLASLLPHAAQDPRLTAQALVHAARLACLTKDMTSCAALLRSAIERLESGLHPALLRDALGLLSRSLEATNQAQAALNACRRHGDWLVLALRPVDDSASSPHPYAPAATPVPADNNAPDTLGAIHEPHVLSLARRFIAAQTTGKIRVNDIAEHCGVSRRTLETAYKAHHQISLGEFLRRRRFETCATGLRDTQRPVEQIAHEAGYKSGAAFSREFRARFGISPMQWRKNAR